MQQQQQNHEINLQFPEHEKLNCPRCESTNTKFCYYNNYNLLQPRYYCKNCRRYWTKGGTLRKIPIGGGIRKKTSPVVKPSADVSPPPVVVENIPVKKEVSTMLGFGDDDRDLNGGESSSNGLNIGLSIFTSSSSSKVD